MEWRMLLLAVLLGVLSAAAGIPTELNVSERQTAASGYESWVGLYSTMSTTGLGTKACAAFLVAPRKIIMTASCVAGREEDDRLVCFGKRQYVTSRDLDAHCYQVTATEAHPGNANKDSGLDVAIGTLAADADFPGAKLLKIGTPSAVGPIGVAQIASAMRVTFKVSSTLGVDYELVDSTNQVPLNSECPLLQLRNLMDNNNVMCGSEEASGCQLDTGGPLVLLGETAEDDVALGLASFQNGLCAGERTTVFTRLSSPDVFAFLTRHLIPSSGYKIDEGDILVVPTATPSAGTAEAAEPTLEETASESELPETESEAAVPEMTPEPTGTPFPVDLEVTFPSSRMGYLDFLGMVPGSTACAEASTTFIPREGLQLSTEHILEGPATDAASIAWVDNLRKDSFRICVKLLSTELFDPPTIVRIHILFLQNIHEDYPQINKWTVHVRRGFKYGTFRPSTSEPMLFTSPAYRTSIASMDMSRVRNPLTVHVTKEETDSSAYGVHVVMKKSDRSVVTQNDIRLKVLEIRKNRGIRTGSEMLPLRSDGVVCKRVPFVKLYNVVPLVLLTPFEDNRDTSVTVWTRDHGLAGFSMCAQATEDIEESMLTIKYAVLKVDNFPFRLNK